MKYRVHFEGRTIEVESGARLRDALMSAGLSPHNGQSRWLNCHGFGTCGTCAVRVDGEVQPPSAREKTRLGFPPHTVEAGLRLACQVRVNAELRVTKYAGFWGQDTTTERPADAAARPTD